MFMETERIFSEIERLKNEMTQALMELIRIPAIAPENGGEGESKKAEKLMQMLKAVGFDQIRRFDAEDARVPSKKRPNILAYIYGEEKDKILWIVTHMDVVPSGEDSLWTVTRPFEPTVKNGKIYGRGSEDNMQSMIASIFAVKALKNLGIKPKRTVGLGLVADEEQGSKYGIQYLIKQGLFKPEDLVIVPDVGNEDGSFIEIAEKSVVWLRIRTIGKQTHASRPEMGLNAHRVGMQYLLALDRLLHEKYPAKDEHFEPPASTFEPTQKERNVDAVNIIPGEDVSYFDCRILPSYDPDEVLDTAKRLAADFEKKTGAKIGIEIVQKTVASEPTDVNAQIVLMLKEAIRKTRGIEPKVGGIGGGTCAAYFRDINVPAAVWSTIDEMAHQPNEYAKIENIVDDAKIFAYLATA
jgi:succinyl-diaminopimelate desuccinylase